MSMSLLDSPQIIKTVYNDANQALQVVTVGSTFDIEVTPNSYKHISSNATTTVKAAPGTLSSIVINTAGTSSNTATVYDSLSGSGTVIAVIDTTSKIVLSYNIAFTTGLTIVTATGTAADITVNYQ